MSPKLSRPCLLPGRPASSPPAFIAPRVRTYLRAFREDPGELACFVLRRRVLQEQPAARLLVVALHMACSVYASPPPECHSGGPGAGASRVYEPARSSRTILDEPDLQCASGRSRATFPTPAGSAAIVLDLEETR